MDGLKDSNSEVFKEIQREIWLLSLPIRLTFNRCLSWNKWVVQEFHQIKTILEKIYDT